MQASPAEADSLRSAIGEIVGGILERRFHLYGGAVLSCQRSESADAIRGEPSVSSAKDRRGFSD